MIKERESNMFQNLGGACEERRCDIRVETGDIDGVKGATDINENSNKKLFVMKGVINMTYERCEAFRGSQTFPEWKYICR